MDEADKLCDRIGIIDYGKLIASDTPTQLKETLQGDVITIKSKNIDKLTAVLSEKLGLTQSMIVDGSLEITVRGGRSIMPRIMDIAAADKLFIDSILLREPNLEDVFLHYTGKNIRAEGGRELHGFAAIQRRKIR